MLFFNEHDDAILLRNYALPLTSTHFWCFDLEMMDYTLTEISTLEELVSPSVTFELFGFTFDMPTHWHILVGDEETNEIDVVDAGSIVGRGYKVVVFGHDMNRVELAALRAVNYSPNDAHTTIALNRKQMLCHPISPTSWIHIAPSDSYTKFLKGKVTGDLYE